MTAGRFSLAVIAAALASLGLASAAQAKFVYTTATSARTSNALTDSSVLVYRSPDGGATWERGVVAMEGGPGSPTSPTPGPSYFRPSLSVERGAGTGGADRVYVVALETTGFENAGPSCPARGCFSARIAVSDDGGQTFSTGVRASPSGADVTDGPSKPIINSDGSITVAWRTFAVQGLLQAARSTDGGKTWSAPVDITKVTNTGTTVPSHVAPGPSSSASYPRMAAHPSTGDIYIVYSQGSTGPQAPAGGYQGADHFISPDSAVWFQRSRDKGATWSSPKLISDRTRYPGSQTIQTRHPTISVSPNGRINIVWHDRRHWYQGPGERNCSHSHAFCEDVRLGDTYYSYSTDGGNTFSPNIRVNDRSHNNEVGYDTRPSAYWNYGPQSVTIGDQVLIGWMDSREGNWDTDNEDIYLSKVDFSATGAVPRTHVDEPDAISRSVALSKAGYRGGTEGALSGRDRDPAGPGSFGPASRNASSVVIVNEGDVAGALAGTVLARANPGPVLLSPSAGLPAGVKAEVSRMRPAKAFVIGDSASLSDQVMTDLAAAAGILPAMVTRLSGGSDAATAALVAARLDYRTAAEQDAGVSAFDAAVIANPTSPDAAAAAGLAAARRLPVLYVGSDSIPSETQAALDSLKIDKTLVIGGAATVSDSVLAGLPSATRLGGPDQYATSKAVVAESAARGLPGNVVYAADGSKPMDAVLLGGVVARATGMLVLAPAPLSSTVTGQASDFGLSGIARFFLVGPAGSAGGPVAAEVRVGPNYKLDSDPSPFRGRDQPALAVDPADPRRVVQVNANYLDLTCEGSVSLDGGASWSPAVRLSPPEPTGSQSPFGPGCFSYQSLEFGSDPPAVAPPPPPAAPPPPPTAPPAAAPPPPPAAPLPVAPSAPASSQSSAPSLTKVSLTHKAFRVKRPLRGKRTRLGTTIRFTLSMPAKVSIVVGQRTIGRRVGKNCVRSTRLLRKRKRCVRTVTLGTLTGNRKKGANSLRFSGRVGGRLLKPGSYRLTLRAEAGGRRSQPVVRAFRVVR